MRRQVVVFIVLLLVAALVAGVTFVNRQGLPGVPVAAKPPIEITVVHASTLDDWITKAADDFNKGNNQVDGRPIQVKLISMDGVEAASRISKEELVPTAWIPESTALLFSSNDDLKAKYGRDLFLTSGEYQRRILVNTFLVWVMWDDRAQVFLKKYKNVEWDTISQLTNEPQGWASAGGNPNWGYPKFSIADPNRATSGLISLIQASYFYHKKTRDLTNEDILQKDYQDWLRNILNSAVDFSSGSSAYAVNELILFGPSRADAALVEESEFIKNAKNAQNRWGKLNIYYPTIVVQLDYPYSIYMTDKTSAVEKDAALAFGKYLLSVPVQQQALKLGFRPGNLDVSTLGPDSPFETLKDIGVQATPATSAARLPDRQVWITLQQFFNRVARK